MGSRAGTEVDWVQMYRGEAGPGERATGRSRGGFLGLIHVRVPWLSRGRCRVGFVVDREWTLAWNKIFGCTSGGAWGGTLG